MARDYITCHILDTVRGLPAAGVPCVLSKLQNGQEIEISGAETDTDGRIVQWGPRVTTATPGPYKIKFETGLYLSKNNDGQAFFPIVEVVFVVSDPPPAHYHIPLLLSNYSYSAYRGN